MGAVLLVVVLFQKSCHMDQKQEENNLTDDMM